MSTVNLYLKGINLADLLERYKNGELHNITQLRGSNLTCQVVQLKKYGESYEDPTFVAKDGNGFDVVSYTAGSGLYALGSFIPAIPAGRRCHNCPKITIKPSIGFILEIQSLGDDNYHLITYRNFCCFECHARKLINETDKNQVDRDFLLKNAGENLKWIFDRLHPGKVLRASPEPELHEGYDGSMTDPEFHQNPHDYYPTNNISISSVKRQYIEA